MGENAVHSFLSPSGGGNALTISTAPAKSGGALARQGNGQRGLGASMNSSRSRAAHGSWLVTPWPWARKITWRDSEKSSLRHGPSSPE